MEDIRRIIVNEHIVDLRRDAEGVAGPPRWAPHITAGMATHRAPRCPTVGRRRVRLGHWLIGLGTAVAGSSGDRRGGTADFSCSFSP